MKKQFNILIVDDNQDNLKVISTILMDKGYKIAVSLDGESALKTVESIDADLILLDVMMPGMNGFETCKRLKENPRTKNIPVIFVTADTDDIVEGFNAGGVDYISKPFRKEELIARVNNQMQLAFTRNYLDEYVKKLMDTLNQTDRLLQSLIPQSILIEYKQKGSIKPKIFNNVGIMVVDFVHFTDVSSNLAPEILFNELNELYTDFDEILDGHGCERIKTAGGSYLAISGMPTTSEHQVSNLINAAVDIISYINKRNAANQIKWSCRIGMDYGDIIGGIVGERKFRYDIFGKPVSNAFHLAATAKAMQINVSDTIYNKFKSIYEFLNIEEQQKECRVKPMHLLKIPS